MFGDLKELLDMMKKSDAHLISLLKKIELTNHHLETIIGLVKEQGETKKNKKGNK